GRALEDGRVIQLSRSELQHAVDELPELGETLVKAFLLRRSLLLGQEVAGITIIGSRFSPESHRLRDFATRNGVAYRWIDLDTDEQADRLLRQFNIPAAATPIVIRNDGGKWVSNPSIT